MQANTALAAREDLSSARKAIGRDGVEGVGEEQQLVDVGVCLVLDRPSVAVSQSSRLPERLNRFFSATAGFQVSFSGHGFGAGGESFGMKEL